MQFAFQELSSIHQYLSSTSISEGQTQFLKVKPKILMDQTQFPERELRFWKKWASVASVHLYPQADFMHMFKTQILL